MGDWTPLFALLRKPKRLARHSHLRAALEDDKDAQCAVCLQPLDEHIMVEHGTYPDAASLWAAKPAARGATWLTVCTHLLHSGSAHGVTLRPAHGARCAVCRCTGSEAAMRDGAARMRASGASPRL